MPLKIISEVKPFLILSTANTEISKKYAEVQNVVGQKKGEIQVTEAGFYQEYDSGRIYWSAKTGAHVVYGDILSKWLRLGGDKSVLGLPITDELGTPDRVGRYNHFQNGSMYWTSSTGAQEIHGAIRNKWSSLGWEKSFLGYPLTDETTAPDGAGKYNHFQFGSVYWTLKTGAYEVHGAIRDKWSSLGWEKSFLGYPTSDEADLIIQSSNKGRYNTFENGNIVWSPEYGASVPATLYVPRTTGGLKPQGLTAPEGIPEIRRKLAITYTIDAVDDETFGNNEIGHDQGKFDILLTNSQGQSKNSFKPLKFGGEIRVEVTLTATYVASNGDANITMNAKLFEGDSEETQDLDDQKTEEFTVGHDDANTISIYLSTSGGDSADIVATVTNFPQV